ncbi:MAG TPA: cytochrome c oxidase subunit II [Blastocatellia bacterium]|nr:cytochrome c oxidase subunit II [Blastocatellia bacterium]
MGKIIAIMLVVLVVGSAYTFVGLGRWFPETIAAHGPAIDAQFRNTLVVVAIAFTLAQLALGYAVVRFGSSGKDARAVYTHGNDKLELVWTAVTAAVFIIVAVLGQRVWASLHLNQAPPDSTRIDAVAQQFQFNFHYAGADGVFGKTEPKFIDDSALNYVGLDPNDTAGKDDVQLTTLVIPQNRPVELTLRSKDVIHSFFVPALRFKQDMVPGMAIKVHFTALKTGKYEIPCAELCGQLHYNMKSFMLVVTGDEYDALTASTGSQFQERFTALQQQYQ